MNPLSQIEELLQIGPYSLLQAEKSARILPRLDALTRFHYEQCPAYRRIVDRAHGGLPRGPYHCLEDIPFFPVSLFKTHRLCSVPEEEVIKVLKSSGTTGQEVSHIYLDRHTATVQAKVLVKLLQFFLGKQRLPMVILDQKNVVSDRRSFSARGAGILGMMQFGVRPFYALREDMSLDHQGLHEYLQEHAGKRVLLFGFTYIIWQQLIEPLQKAGQSLDIANGILIHSGGWKKLEDQHVSTADFNRQIAQTLGIQKCVNFYGMVEQVGSVYLENPLGYLHTPLFSEVIVRDPYTLEVLADGDVGLIQVLFVLPGSYPGHSVLTEDLGRIVGRDTPELEMKGRYFEVSGRVPKSEPRGCSDTYQPPEEPVVQ